MTDKLTGQMRRGRKPGPMCRIDPLALTVAMHVVGMSAAELADATGLSDQTIKRLLTGGTTTARSIAEALAAALECEVSRLVIV
jgi:DNA-binding Xre family transcriptional regulator